MLLFYHKIHRNSTAHPILYAPIEIGNPLQICELVKNSSLLSFLPDFISEKYVKDGQIKRLDVAGCPVTVWTQLLLHKNKWRSPAINVFIEFYKEVMQR